MSTWEKIRLKAAQQRKDTIRRQVEAEQDAAEAEYLRYGEESVREKKAMANLPGQVPPVVGHCCDCQHLCQYGECYTIQSMVVGSCDCEGPVCLYVDSQFGCVLFKPNGGGKRTSDRSAGTACGHAGDCTIYAALSSGNASDGICTCGYGAACRGRGDESEMYSAERQADDAAGIAWWNSKSKSEREAMLHGLHADPRTALACWELFGRHSR